VGPVSCCHNSKHIYLINGPQIEFVGRLSLIITTMETAKKTETQYEDLPHLSELGNKHIRETKQVRVLGKLTHRVFLGNFDSFAEFNTYARTLGKGTDIGGQIFNLPFNQCLDNFQRAIETPNKKLEKHFSQLVQDRRIIPPIDTPDFYHQISGSYVDVGRYVTGEPECMVDYEPQKPTKFLTIYLRAAAVGNEPSYFGMICQIIDYLERHGTRCKLVAELSHVTDKNAHLLARFTVKETHEPLNISQFCSMFLSGALSELSLYFCTRFFDTLNAKGYDKFYELNEEIPPQREEPNVITFPSQRFHRYYARPATDPHTYLKELGIEEILIPD